MSKLVRNAIKCKLCGEVIESTHRHNFVTCGCGNCSVDGGLDYQRIICNNLETVENISIIENSDDLKG